MIEESLLAPIEGDDPCGPDLRWDPEFLAMGRSLAAAVSQDAERVIDADLAGRDAPTFAEVAGMARELCARTKDLRVFTAYAEVLWRDQGLVAFAGAMETLATAMETWPGFDDGLHPRADEEDNDIGERVAALGKLLNIIPALVDTVGWGDRPEMSIRIDCANQLKGVFDSWTARLEPGFGPDLPSSRQAWTALQKLIKAESAAAGAAGGMPDDADGVMDEPASEDAWDLVEQAAETMSNQDHHSPALPVLRMVMGWRSLGIIEIADTLKRSGVTLEQLLESVRRQTET